MLTIHSAFIVCLATLVVSSAKATTASKFIFEDLVNDILDASNPDVIPQTSSDKPVSVGISLELINIYQVDSQAKHVFLDAWVKLTWNSGITFDPAKYNNITSVRLPPSQLWRPDVAVYNGELTLPGPNGLSDKILMFSTGDALWVPKSRVRVMCKVDDDVLAAGGNVTCEAKFGSWTYSSNNVILESNPKCSSYSYFEDSSFQVVETYAKKEAKMYACCAEEYEDILFTFTFRQQQ